MKCPSCNVDRKSEDFYGKDRCYKCIYDEKVLNIPPKPYECKKCRICDEQLMTSRPIYCSDECLIQGRANLRSNYWHKKLQITGLSFKESTGYSTEY